MSDHIKIAEAPTKSKFTKGEQLYEQYLFDLSHRRFLNGANGFDENPFVRWSKLTEEERLSWEWIAKLKLSDNTKALEN